MDIPHFKIPLNLPHAAKVATRIEYHLERTGARCTEALNLARALSTLLEPYMFSGENPPGPEAETCVKSASEILTALVAEIEQHEVGSDKLGQSIRNVYECLEMGREGARQSLRAGENPGSALRPYN